MTDPNFEQAHHPTTAGDDVGGASTLIWIVVAIVVAAVCLALALAYFEPYPV